MIFGLVFVSATIFYFFVTLNQVREVSPELDTKRQLILSFLKTASFVVICCVTIIIVTVLATIGSDVVDAIQRYQS